MREAIFYTKLKDNFVRCDTCNQRCIIKDGDRGFCGVRKNENGKLILLVYGKAIAINVDPIEKKPLFHFLPGSNALSFGTVGCNFECSFCQNWTISQAPKEKFFWHGENIGKEWLPAKIITDALKQDCQSIAYTYNEPTVFLEYALDTMKLAHEVKLKNIWVSNGYMSPETLSLILPYLDAINIDLKSFSEKFYQEYCGAKFLPVLENIKKIKKAGVWLELTTLLIPNLNDSTPELKKIANFIVNDVGKDTPWHISRFYPAYKMNALETTDAKLIDKAVKIGKDAGLKYVYAGNLPGSSHENTFCPHCKKIVIERVGYIVRRLDRDGICPYCKTNIDLILK